MSHSSAGLSRLYDAREYYNELVRDFGLIPGVTGTESDVAAHLVPRALITGRD